MEEAALAMRDVMSREEEPSFVIKDPRYVKGMSTSFLIISRCWTVSYAADISTNAALLSSIFRSRLRCCRVKLGS